MDPIVQDPQNPSEQSLPPPITAPLKNAPLDSTLTKDFSPWIKEIFSMLKIYSSSQINEVELEVFYQEWKDRISLLPTPKEEELNNLIIESERTIVAISLQNHPSNPLDPELLGNCLQKACKLNHFVVVQTILSIQPLRKEISSENLGSALSDAAREGSGEVIDWILSNETLHDMMPLYSNGLGEVLRSAAMFGEAKLIRNILNNKSYLEKILSEGWAHLYSVLLASNFHETILEVILSIPEILQKIQENVLPTKPFEDALLEAIRRNKISFVEIFLPNKVLVDSISGSIFGASLCKAATDGYLPIAKKILANEGIAQKIPHDGEGSLMKAIYSANQRHFYDILDLILSNSVFTPTIREDRRLDYVNFAAERDCNEFLKKTLLQSDFAKKIPLYHFWDLRFTAKKNDQNEVLHTIDQYLGTFSLTQRYVSRFASWAIWSFFLPFHLLHSFLKNLGII
jgi:hypothetical protein